jgi:uncharacterized protein
MISNLILTMTGVLAASVLRGFTGFGFGLAAVPLLSLALPPTQVVPLVVTLQVIVGVAGLRAATAECDWRAIRLLTPGLLIGVPVGLLVLTSLPANPVRLAIGGMIALSVVMIGCGIRLPPNPSRLLSFVVGWVSGVMSGLASMGGPPVIVFLLTLGHSSARMRATSIVYFMLAGCVSLIPMVVRGLITPHILVWAVGSLPVLFLGSRIGAWGFFRTKPRHHHLVALTSLAALAALLIGRAFLD